MQDGGVPVRADSYGTELKDKPRHMYKSAGLLGKKQLQEVPDLLSGFKSQLDPDPCQKSKVQRHFLHDGSLV